MMLARVGEHARDDDVAAPVERILTPRLVEKDSVRAL